jgi:hypothetical protein
MVWDEKPPFAPDCHAFHTDFHPIVSGGMIFPENRRFDIPFFFPGLFFRLFS